MKENINEHAIDILLCEDNPDDADLTIRALKKHGITNSLMHVKNGEEALNYIFGEGPYAGRTMTCLPKLIVLDLKMPKVDGLEVLRRLKSDARTTVIPVVLLTSSKEDKDIRESYELGVNSYIVKPVDFEGFVKAVSSLGFYWLLLNQPCQA